MLNTDDPWLTSPLHTGRVPINASSIEACIRGPARPDGTPLVIIEAGHGTTHYGYAAAARSIAESFRVLSYSRAGYGNSALGPDSPRTLHNLNAELHALLKAIGQPPPYVLVGHSYGGNIVRGFLNEYPDEVAGMVLLDSYCIYDPPLPNHLFGPILGPDGEKTYKEVLGLKENSKLTVEENAARREAEGREHNGETAQKEASFFMGEVDKINKAQGLYQMVNGSWAFRDVQLRGKRLSVISGSTSNDFRKLLENAEAKGYGTAEERAEFREFVEAWAAGEKESKNCALSLSDQARLAVAAGTAATHNLQIVAPELVAEEVVWVMGVGSVR